MSSPKPIRRNISLWTAANIVTCVRIVLVPLWLLLAELASPSDGSTFSFAALFVFIFFIALSLTDSLDGYLARSRNEVSDFGKFLDPIADKLVVVVGLAFLLEVDVISPWILLVVVAREFLVSGLRMVVASKGTVVAASYLGKLKTATTMISILGFLFSRALPAGAFLNIVLTLSSISMVLALILTIWSGIDYFAKCWRYIRN